MFRELGAAAVVADQVSRDLMQPGEPLLARVIEAFGPGFRRPDGNLDRKALAKLVFADDDARCRLEALTHPAMIEEMRLRVEQAQAEGYPLIVVEAAVLYTMGADKLVDYVVLVTAGREERLRRLMQRDGLCRTEAEARLQLHERIGLDHPPADYVIDTTAGLEDTRRQVECLWRQFVSPNGE